MDAKISSAFWADPEFEEAAPPVKLAALWAVTNSETDMCGVFKFSARRFAFETNADPSDFETLVSGSRSFVMIGDYVFCRSFIRYQVGNGAALLKNSLCKSLIGKLYRHNKEIQTAVLDEYPCLRERFEDDSPPVEVKPRVKTSKTSKEIEQAKAILATVNEIAGTKYLNVDTNLNLIIARLREVKGDTEGVVKMLRRQWDKVKGNEYREFFRPETLFGKTKFASYWGQKDIQVAVDGESSRARLKYLEGAILLHPANKSSSAYNPMNTPAQREELIKLNTEKRDLERRLNG